MFPADATNGVEWLFRWNAAQAHWTFQGGAPLVSVVSTAVTQSPTVSGVWPATSWPLLGVPRSGSYLATIVARLYDVNGSFNTVGSGNLYLFNNGAGSGIQAAAVLVNGWDDKLLTVGPYPINLTLGDQLVVRGSFDNAGFNIGFNQRGLTLLPRYVT